MCACVHPAATDPRYTSTIEAITRTQESVRVFSVSQCLSVFLKSLTHSLVDVWKRKKLNFIILMRERKSRRSATTSSDSSAMVPQQQTSNGSRADSPSTSGVQPKFGSLLVDRKSSTPYSDATQVGISTTSVKQCSDLCLVCLCVCVSVIITRVCVCVRGRVSSISFPSSNKRNNHVMEVSLIALRPCHELGVMPVVIRHHFSSHPSLGHLVMNFSLPFFFVGGV